MSFGGKSSTPDVKATAPAPKIGATEAEGRYEKRRQRRRSGIGDQILSGLGEGSSVLGK